MTALWRIVDGELKSLDPVTPKLEKTLENWVAADPSVLGLEALVVGQEVTTAFGGRIDILAMDQQGDLIIIELKRGRTPREVVAQALDYASWVADLSTRAVYDLCTERLKRPLSDAFHKRFGTTLPETLNSSHKIIIVAGSLDASSKRIVEYLAEHHGLSINTAFFTFYRDGAAEYVSADWLMDQEQVEERSAQKSKAPWNGYYFVNVGENPGHRSWDDMAHHGFLAAGNGFRYSNPLAKLAEGDPVFAYQRGKGYVGFGRVVSDSSVKAIELELPNGQALKDADLKDDGLFHDSDNDELAEYAVAVRWDKTLPLTEAKWFSGGFANQNIVCKLRHRATIDFLEEVFGLGGEP